MLKKPAFLGFLNSNSVAVKCTYSAACMKGTYARDLDGHKMFEKPASRLNATQNVQNLAARSCSSPESGFLNGTFIIRTNVPRPSLERFRNVLKIRRWRRRIIYGHFIFRPMCPVVPKSVAGHFFCLANNNWAKNPSLLFPTESFLFNK